MKKSSNKEMSRGPTVILKNTFEISFQKLFMHYILDKGETVTIINLNVIKEIGAIVSEVNVAFQGIGDDSSITVASRKVTINIEEINDYISYTFEKVLVLENLALPLQNVSVDLAEYCAGEKVIQVDSFSAAPDLLIGQSHCQFIITREHILFGMKNLILSKCLLSWSITVVIRKMKSCL